MSKPEIDPVQYSDQGPTAELIAAGVSRSLLHISREQIRAAINNNLDGARSCFADLMQRVPPKKVL